MKQYLAKRISQPTTWLGILGAAASMIASGGVPTVEGVGMLCTALGLVHVDEGLGR